MLYMNITYAPYYTMINCNIKNNIRCHNDAGLFLSKYVIDQPTSGAHPIAVPEVNSR